VALGTVPGMTGGGAADGAPGGSPRAVALLRLLSALPGRREEAIAIVNGLFGDALEERGSPLTIPMTLRVGDTVLPPDPGPLAGAITAAAPRVNGRICVLVHGLMSTESIWRFPDDRSTTYATLLADDHDVTVLTVRYNTGRHISTNGRQLSHLLAELVRAWPVPITEISLIGHSMGGLVIRSACHYGRTTRPHGRRFPIGRRWTSRVRRIVLIGVPNTGAGLEALVNSASAALWELPLPVTRLVGLGLDRRSAGIKDLRFGAIVDDDWLEHDPGVRQRPHPYRRLRLRRARSLVIAGSLTADPEHPVALQLGDALVTTSSAAGIAGDDELLPRATQRVLPKVTHLALAHHPDVYAAISEWW
jgi:triacylglycerol lipase